MRNISQFAVSMVLLASQVHIPFLGDGSAIASALAPSDGVYEVKLDTSTATGIELIAQKPLDYDQQVLVPLHAAQAATAARAAAAQAALAARVTTYRIAVVVAPVAVVAGSHADWMRAAGIAASDFGYVDYIVGHESGWVATKSNYAGSGAYGLGQAFPASKMAKFGADYMSNPIVQLRWANSYAVGTYGSWAKAYDHWFSHHSW
jgi:hypothetical protein